MKIRRAFGRNLLIGGLAIIVAGGVFVFGSGVLFPEVKQAHPIVWRARVLMYKATGRVPELSWREVAQGLWPGPKLKGSWPGSGFINDMMVKEGLGIDAAVANPMHDAVDIDAGRELFVAQCAQCHGSDGSGGPHAPSLKGASYRVGNSDFALYRTLRDGIPDSAMGPRPLSVAERWQVIGYLRKLSGAVVAIADGEQRVPPIDVRWEDLLAARGRTSDWLSYSGALDGWRHSPLRGITPHNAAGMQMLWAHQFEVANAEPFEATPIVAGGTLFITQPPSDVAAIDARTGSELWRYDRHLAKNIPVCCRRVNRGLAILGDTLFLATLDAMLVAIDARTGRMIWETRVADPNGGYSMTVAPLVIKDAVVVGVSGGEFGIRGFIAAYDPGSGRERWRFQTIPGPGEPGHETWENEAWKTGGGPAWITGAYDPDSNLLYWGIGNPAPDYAGDVRPGDNLYTASVVALDGSTGKRAWHFQFTPHDSHDWDSNQTPVLADLSIDGVPRKVLCWANRNGFYYVLDRLNGEFLRGAPFVKVNWASGLDADGRPVLTPAAELTFKGTLTEPWFGGGTNWAPPSFDPATQTFLVHATEGSSIYHVAPPEQVKRGSDGAYMGGYATIAREPVNLIRALDATTGKLRWEYAAPLASSQLQRFYGGVLSTGGGVAFTAIAGNFLALDIANGRELWRAGLGGPTSAAPISFELDGRQVVAITGGRALFLFGLPGNEAGAPE